MGIPCQSFILINPNLITCVTGENKGVPSSGNIIVKMESGLTSPIRTCKMFEYGARTIVYRPPIIKVVKPSPFIIQQVKVKKNLFPEDIGKRRPKKLLGEPDC